MTRFSQKEIANLFHTTPENVTMHLREARWVFERRSATEGRRVVSRNLKTYDISAVYSVGVRTRKLDKYFELCKNLGIDTTHFHVSRKENEFGDLLEKFLRGKATLSRQYPIGRYMIDFFVEDAMLAIEFDERPHAFKTRAAKDLLRQREIESTFGVRFVRVSEGNELPGLFDVAKALFEQSSFSRELGGGARPLA